MAQLAHVAHAVSYTHLDVYKRQALEVERAKAEAAGLVFVDAGTFTYTVTKEALEREKRLRIVPRR